MSSSSQSESASNRLLDDCEKTDDESEMGGLGGHSSGSLFSSFSTTRIAGLGSGSR